MTKYIIPSSFILDKTSLTWREILYGLSRELIGVKTPIDVAIQHISKSDSYDFIEIELAGLLKNEWHKVSELVQTLANNEAEQDKTQIKRKWLYLLLAWVYERRHSYEDPLLEVEAIYAIFDYPEEVAPFVRYMPADDNYSSQHHSYEENINRLFDLWRLYLDQQCF